MTKVFHFVRPTWPPAASVSPYSAVDCPIAETAIWQGRSNSEPSSGIGRRRPDLSGSPSFIRWHRRAFSFPFSSTMPTGAASSMISIPSARQSSISIRSAGISSFVRRYTMMTLSAPSRHVVRATSMAVLPPPTTAIVPLIGAGRSLSSGRNSAPWTTPSVLNSPGSFIGLPAQAPGPRNTASCPFMRSSSEMSCPTRVPYRISAPARQMYSTSRSTTSSGRRYEGIP